MDGRTNAFTRLTCRQLTCYFTGRRILVTVLLMAVMMIISMTYDTTTILIMDEKKPPLPEKNHEPFIPEFPNQTRIGKPADIPKRFLIEEADACLRKGDDVEVVVYVHSAISRVKKRRQTRLTWANSTALRMVVVFMVGHAKNDKEREIVQRESELYHDIVQGDYGDHYRLLSYKGLSSLYWITRNCAHVPWTLHADDDLLIDTFILRKLIQKFDRSSDREMFHCRILKRQQVFRKGRWSVTKNELSARFYPPFCQGPMWLIPTKQIPKILQAAALVKFLWVDDAYITGMLGGHAGLKISPIPINYFGIGSYSEDDLGKKFTWFHIHNKNLTELWLEIVKHHNALQVLQ